MKSRSSCFVIDSICITNVKAERVRPIKSMCHFWESQWRQHQKIAGNRCISVVLIRFWIRQKIQIRASLLGAFVGLIWMLCCLGSGASRSSCEVRSEAGADSPSEIRYSRANLFEQQSRARSKVIWLKVRFRVHIILATTPSLNDELQMRQSWARHLDTWSIEDIMWPWIWSIEKLSVILV
jgi:hypothetical protein